MPCYRVLDAAGRPLDGAEVPHPLSEAEAVQLYNAMARMQVMDTLFYEAQRQVRRWRFRSRRSRLFGLFSLVG